MREFLEVASYLHEGLAFLDNWKLSANSDEICHSPLLGEQLLVSYASETTGMNFRVYYSSAHDNKPARFFASVNSNKGRSLFLEEFLENNGQEKFLTFFRNTEPKKTLRDFSLSFTKIMHVILENQLADVMLGRSEIPPFDWQPYK